MEVEFEAEGEGGGGVVEEGVESEGGLAVVAGELGMGGLHCGKGETGRDAEEIGGADELVGDGGDGVARGDLGVEDVEGEGEE